MSNRSWESVAGNHEDVRVGVRATTRYGTGIVIDRDKNMVVVAFETVMGNYEYMTMPIQDVIGSWIIDGVFSDRGELYQRACKRILINAHETNREYELDRSKRAIAGLNNINDVNISRRISDTGSGSATFVRLRVQNLFDFEICETVPLVGDADLIEYAKAMANGEDVTGRSRAFWYRGRILRAEILLEDINFGKVHSSRD